MDAKEQLIKKIAELTNRKNELKNEEQAVKLTMNSIYGATANHAFACKNLDVAEAVTLQGQDLIKFAEKIINKYFHEHWHLDKELHEKIGLTSVKRVYKPLVVYIDTDSNYVSFEEVVKSCDWTGDAQDLILQINENRLSSYLKNCMEIYAKKWGTQNAQDFELETLSHNAIFIGKKKYVVNLAYDSGISIPSLKELKFTGVEMIKGGTPPFVREKLVYLTKYIFDNGSKFELKNFVKEIKEIKKQFKIQSPDLISAGITINNYEKFILNDTTGLEVGGSCPIHVRASGYHNYILNNSKYKSKYPLIRSGERIRWYFVKTKKETDCNVFAYSQGTYPYEYAPPIDYDMQFTKTILDPINRFVEAMGLNPISPNLFTITALF
jgi:DNA polymerase elongation subunit (family B)